MEYKDRKKDILDILYANGRVSVSKLAKTLFVSEMTIRRDLSEMEKDGVLKRYRGGAVLTAVSSEMSISQRASLYNALLTAKDLRNKNHI